jgi:hypothetical protein
MERELETDNQSQKMELDVLRKEIPTAYFTVINPCLFCATLKAVVTALHESSSEQKPTGQISIFAA